MYLILTAPEEGLKGMAAHPAGFAREAIYCKHEGVKSAAFLLGFKGEQLAGV